MGGAIIVCILLLGVAIVCAAVLCHKIRMRELTETRRMDHLSGGMLNDANDARLAQTKTTAMTMDMANTSTGVQLQSVDSMIESDKQKNDLLDDEEDVPTQQEEEVVDENQENPGAQE